MRRGFVSMGTLLLLMVIYPVTGYTSCLLITKNGNIRSGPGTNFKIVGTVKALDVFEGHVDSTDPDWFKSETKRSVRVGERWEEKYVTEYVYKNLGRVFDDCDAVREKMATFPNQPDGFRGIKWGTRIESFQHMKLLEHTGGFEVYVKKNDKLSIGEADLDKIVYMFYQGRFAGLLIEYKSASEYRVIRRTLAEAYGPGRKLNGFAKRHNWDGFDILIVHEFNKAMNKGSIFYAYKPIMEKREREEKKKAKAGVEDL